MDLKIELILIGDELLNGHKKDANLSQLTQLLAIKGLKLCYVQIISDKILEISSALTLASRRSEIIITSGGLGPTLDDLTKDALSHAFTLPLEFSQQAKDVTLKNYERYQRESNFAINKYDHIPRNTVAVENLVGFAPGICYQDPQQKFTLLLAPGVPKEFKMMAEQFINSQLQKIKNYSAKKQLQWRTYGIAEEKIFSELAPTLWSHLEKFGAVSSLPHLSGVDIRLSVDEKIGENQLLEIEKIILTSGLKPYIWSRDNGSLPEYLVSLAKKLKITFGFVESATGGMASHLITQVAGCSEVFMGSLVTYQTSLKQKILGIDSSITKTSAVNQESALSMSQNGKNILQVDFCISFTGFAGPSGGDAENPVGRLWLGCSSKDDNLTKKIDFIGNRTDRIERFTYAGLHFLRQELEKLVNL